ncbi:MAG: sulfite exporter TauE/SafE family protein [Patescibacteria group bacterium]|jgi:sulfite exporter TauE/SafE/copper chaperone CopZ
MLNQENNLYQCKISGMHCEACEILLERKLKEASGVISVKVNHANGKAKLICTSEPDWKNLQAIVKHEGYDLTYSTDGQAKQANNLEKVNHWQIAGFFLVVIVGLWLLNKLQLLPEGFGVSNNMSYGLIFGIGLVAAVSSCLAVTGGLLLALAAKEQTLRPNLTGWRKFRPYWHFNLGRLVGYTVFGGLIGALGSGLSLSVSVSNLVTIIASIVMILLGFNLLQLFPQLRVLHPRMPKFLGHKIHDLVQQENSVGPFILGGLTFFLPCGFTVALQLYVLSQGGILTGALTMLVFALGTLPALLFISILSSFIKTSWRNYFIKFAGVLVVVIGLLGLKSGLAFLRGTQTGSVKQGVSSQNSSSVYLPLVDGKQIAQMEINGLGYYPSIFKVKAGIPVEWQIDGTKASGCAQVVVSRGLGIQEIIPRTGIKTITFTPTQTGKIAFSCPMGMTTPGSAFIVE